MKTGLKPLGLTTTKAPFIEMAKTNGELFIHQPYELYSTDNQEAWKKLYQLLVPKWKKYANEKFLQGLENLALNPEQIPTLEEVNRFLKPLTGFQAKAVSGYVPAYLFFDSLKKREFPTTITIRDSQKLNYLPEPDIFHDLAGHVPMHTDPIFAEVLVKFGSLATLAAERAKTLSNYQERFDQLSQNTKALTRFFWFTVEFGLMKHRDKLCVYGSGLLSSAEEIVYSIESPHVQRYPFQIEWVINQPFGIDHLQPLLFYVDSFEHLYDQVKQLEILLKNGKLDHVAPGDPIVSEEDVGIFIA